MIYIHAVFVFNKHLLLLVPRQTDFLHVHFGETSLQITLQNGAPWFITIPRSRRKWAFCSERYVRKEHGFFPRFQTKSLCSVVMLLFFRWDVFTCPFTSLESVERQLHGVLRACKSVYEQRVYVNSHAPFARFLFLLCFDIEIVKYAKNITGLRERGTFVLWYESRFLCSRHWKQEQRKSSDCILQTINFTEEHDTSTYISEKRTTSWRLKGKLRWYACPAVFSFLFATTGLFKLAQLAFMFIREILEWKICS